MTPARQLREQLDSGMVLAAGVYNALFARIAEEVGFRSLYMTGFGTAARYGFPDVGLVTQTEMADNLAYICAATSLPVIADADTGYGGVVNVRRTVEEYEALGVAALHIEDQTFPKKCGFMEGKSVIDAGEATSKVRAAVDARRDPDLVVIARTDALAVNGWDDTVARARAFLDAGADLVFVDGIRTRQDLETYSERLARRGVPALYNGALVSADEAEALGFRVQILAGLALGAAYQSMHEAMAELQASGSVSSVVERYRDDRAPNVNEALGLSGIYELERRYAVSTPGGTP